jgi:hypothetical protein
MGTSHSLRSRLERDEIWIVSGPIISLCRLLISATAILQDAFVVFAARIKHALIDLRFLVF